VQFRHALGAASAQLTRRLALLGVASGDHREERLGLEGSDDDESG